MKFWSIKNSNCVKIYFEKADNYCRRNQICIWNM